MNQSTKSQKQQSHTNRLALPLGALLCCLLWGSAFPCIKLGYAWLQIPAEQTSLQITYAGVRFLLAGILTIILGSLIQRKPLLPRRQSLLKIVWLSLLQTVLQYLFFYIGLAHTSGVKASIIEAVNVFVAIFVAAILFHQEKITPRKMIGSFIGFAGVVLVNVSDGKVGAGFSLAGEGAILLSTISYAFSSVYLKKFSATENPVMLSGYQFCLGGLVMILCGCIFGRGQVGAFMQSGVLATAQGRNGILMLLYLAGVSAVAYSVWGLLLKAYPVSKVAVYGFMNPVFGVLLSAILLQEHNAFGLEAVVSLVLVCVGIYVVNRQTQSERDK